MANISRDIQVVVSAPESKDELKWMHNSDGSPTIRDFYDHMRSKGSMNIWSELFGDTPFNPDVLLLYGRKQFTVVFLLRRVYKEKDFLWPLVVAFVKM